MKVLKITFYIIAFFGFSVVFYLAFYGMFTSLEIRDTKVEHEVLVYEPMRGDYKKSKNIMDNVHNVLLDSLNIKTELGFGIYLDNPSEVATDSLRSEIGCILKECTPDQLALIEKYFKVKDMQNKAVVEVHFPFKGPASVLVGLLKVYPVVSDYVTEKGLHSNAMMEVYDVANNVIKYRALLD